MKLDRATATGYGSSMEEGETMEGRKTMEDVVPLRIRLHGKGIKAATLPWSELREFVDAFVEALTAMPDGPEAKDVVFSKVEEGSAISVVYVPRATLLATRVLARGPNPRWTSKQRRAAESLYMFVRDRKATLEVGQRALHSVVIPDQAAKWTVRESAELRGTMIMAGGREMKVRIDLDCEGLVICEAEPAVVKELGARLQESVFVEGVFTRDAVTGTILHGVIRSWRPAPERAPGSKVLRELQDLLASSMSGFDWQAYWKEQRS